MNTFTRRGFVVLGAAGLLSACSTLGPAGSTSPTALSVAAVTDKINATRRANGQLPVAYNPKLANAARYQADLMATKDQLSHDLGISLRQRVTQAGFDGAVGENVAGGHPTLEAAIQGWLDSPSHRSTLLSSKFTEFGLAAASVGNGRKSRYGTYWALVMGGAYEAWY